MKALVPALVFPLLVAGCGDSDLSALQLEEIENAQRELDDQPDFGAGNNKTDVELLLENRKLVFSQEFSNDAIDPAVWNTAYAWGSDSVVNSEQQYYVDVANQPDFGINPFSTNGYYLTISAMETPNDLLAQANAQPYLSGALTTRGKFSFSYGYAEVRAKMPVGKGLWPGFWMLGEEFADRKPQLFVMENRGDNNSLVYHRYNFTDDTGTAQYSDLLKSAESDYTIDFHTFGVDWQPGKLSFYVDGMLRHTLVNEGVASQEMYLILNLAVGGWFPDSPDATTPFPADFVVDYVRVYQANDSE